MNRFYQLLFTLSLFMMNNSNYMVHSASEVEEAVEEKSASSSFMNMIQRTLQFTWTAKPSTTTVRSGGSTYTPPQARTGGSGGQCNLCHDGSYPKNPSRGVTVGFTTYSFQGTCANLYNDLKARVPRSHQICNPLQDRFDWTCGCNAAYVPPAAKAGTVNQGQGYGTWGGW